jgi:hypothetical protein
MVHLKILGVAFLLLGTISIIYNKRSADRYAEFQKGWGLEGRNGVVVGRLISILGGLMFVVIGLLCLSKYLQR